ncbi:MAG: hypothetical protein ACOZJZ_00035 [Pseudomonadota bacterium]
MTPEEAAAFLAQRDQALLDLNVAWFRQQFNDTAYANVPDDALLVQIHAARYAHTGLVDAPRIESARWLVATGNDQAMGGVLPGDQLPR